MALTIFTTAARRVRKIFDIRVETPLQLTVVCSEYQLFIRVPRILDFFSNPRPNMSKIDQYLSKKCMKT